MGLFAKLWARWKAYDRSRNFTCDVCGREVFAGERLCKPCERALPFVGQGCPVCGRRVLEPGVCVTCKAHRPVVRKARSACVYEKDAMRLMLRYKRGEKYLAVTLVHYMLPLLYEVEGEALVPVPMTERARRRRGYDQTRLLAEELSRGSGLPLLLVTEKRRETAPQKALSRQEREENLSGCFHVTDRAAIRGKKLIAVDDVYTTGATANEFATTLLRAGASEVSIITFASVEGPHPATEPTD